MLVATLRNLLSQVMQRRRRLNDERQLRELPDRAMADLGIGRSEICAALRFGRDVDRESGADPACTEPPSAAVLLPIVFSL